MTGNASMVEFKANSKKHIVMISRIVYLASRTRATNAPECNTGSWDLRAVQAEP